MSIQNEIQAQVVAAMKAGANQRRDALRLILNAIKVEAKDQRRDLSLDEERQVLSREAKKRREAIEGYQMVNNLERAQKENEELAIIQEFLPQALTAEEVKAIIQSIVAELQVTSKNDFGRVMKALLSQTSDRFPGKDAKSLVDQAFLQLFP
ncbi:MAG: GatB/YqeY domain-containing protein [Proteobacteria bacterium]|nr:GatB/YqeY domain-containing protein [Pseudomonadota bacterium]